MRETNMKTMMEKVSFKLNFKVFKWIEKLMHDLEIKEISFYVIAGVVKKLNWLDSQIKASSLLGNVAKLMEECKIGEWKKLISMGSWVS